MNNTLIGFIAAPGFRAACLLVGAGLAAWLFIGADASTQPQWIREPFDKLAHFTYFSTIAVLFAHAGGVKRLWLPLILVPLIGALDEWHQMSVPGRYGSVWDWSADFAGSLIAIYGYRRWFPYPALVASKQGGMP
ncbi:MAG: VanZ family protein [Burkholderiales bacterium]